MPDRSRRDALQAVAATTTGILAGCSSDGGGDRDQRLSRRVTDYTRLSVRTDAATLLIDRGETDGADGAIYLTRADQRDRLRFGDGDPARRLEQFVRGTDLSERSVYLYERELSACHRLRLVRVTRAENGIHASFCRELRPADVRCDADATVRAAVALRLPFPGDGIDSVGGGFGSECDRPPAATATGDGGGGA